MAIARRGTPTLVGNNTGSTSTGAIAVPSGVQNGDGLILVLWLLGGASLTVTAGLSGWTLKKSIGTSTVCTALLYTRVASSEPASYTATISASCRTVAQMVAYSGTDQTDFVETTDVTAGGTTVHTTPSLTAADANDWAFCYFGDRTSTAGGQTTSWTPGAGMNRIAASFANNNAAGTSPWGTLDCCDSNGTITAAAHSYSDTANQSASNAVAGLVIIKQAGSVTPISLTDSGAGADTATVAAAVPLTETGASADSATVAAAVPVTDTGIAADTVAVAAAVPLTESPSATDTVALTATVPISDSGTAADTATIAAAAPLADTGTAVEQLATGAAVTLAEAASAVDMLTTVATVALVDAAAADDSTAIAAAVDLTELGAAAEHLGTVISVILLTPGRGIGTLPARPGASTHHRDGADLVERQEARLR